MSRDTLARQYPFITVDSDDDIDERGRLIF